MNALDLFAGPGGWDIGARELGIDPLGIENDGPTAKTRRAAGLRTIRADVSTLDPADGGYGPVDLLIASPPCQAWSMAGRREGEHDLQEVFRLARRWGHDAAAGGPWVDARSPLTAEPMRWVDALEPSYIAFEQVPPVLDLWRVCASLLAERGYAVWTGLLSAERYGVPQTRKRAILLASKVGGANPPLPTHLPYVHGEPKPTEPALTLEGELLPWVSMAEALGWVETDRVGFPRQADELEATEDGYRERDFRDAAEPAFALTEKARSALKMRANAQTRAAERAADEPAPTITGGHDTGERVWMKERPAIRIFAPGGHTAHDGRDNSRTRGRSQDATRVTVEEASALQTFPPGYPWQGSRTAQFAQIGNAMPVLLATAVLKALIA